MSKRALENWYFEYSEAEREFVEAKRDFEVKRRDVCFFLFSVYAKWCKDRFGKILRPEPSNGSEAEKPLNIFFIDFEVDSFFQDAISKMLNQAFDEKFEGVQTMKE